MKNIENFHNCALETAQN